MEYKMNLRIKNKTYYKLLSLLPLKYVNDEIKQIQNLKLIKNLIRFKANYKLNISNSKFKKESLKLVSNNYIYSFSISEDNFICAVTNGTKLDLYCINPSSKQGYKKIILSIESTHNMKSVDFCFSNNYGFDYVFATGNQNKEVVIYGFNYTNIQLNTLQKLVRIEDHTSAINKVCFSKTNNYIASCGDDYMAYVYEIKLNEDKSGNIKVDKVIGVKDTYYITCICFSSDNKYFATGGYDKKAIIYSLHKEKLGQVLYSFELVKPVSCIAFSNTSNLFVVGINNGELHIYNFATRVNSNQELTQYKHEFEENKDNFKNIVITISSAGLTDLCFSQTNKVLAIGDINGKISFITFDLTTPIIFGKELINSFKQSTSSISKVLFTPYYNVFATGGYDKTVHIYY